MSDLIIEVIISNGNNTTKSAYRDKDAAIEFIERVNYEHEQMLDNATGGNDE